ncbi:MAG: DUF4238 domain-containing protein [Chloroflexota bacterium]|nr:DUF4238 domain-containing protein [Chloroflexota bacterium]
MDQAEGKYLNYLKRFCQNPSVAALEVQKGDLAKMLAYFLSIAAAVREGYEQIFADLNATLPEGRLDLDPVKLRREFIAMVPKAIPQLRQTLMQMKWVLIHRGSPLRFWTSDFPFAFETKEPLTLPTAHDEDGVWVSLYEDLLRVPDVHMWFPLSPNLILLLCDPVVHARVPHIHKASFSLTREINLTQVRAGQRFVFSTEPNFGDVVTLLKESPELLKPGRRRWFISNVQWDPVLELRIGQDTISPDKLNLPEIPDSS